MRKVPASNSRLDAGTFVLLGIISRKTANKHKFINTYCVSEMAKETN